MYYADETLLDALTKMNLNTRVVEAIKQLDGERGKSAYSAIQELRKWRLVVNIALVWETGRCHYERKLVEIHRELMCLSTIDRINDRAETVLHEVSHIIVAFFYRDTKWDSVAQTSPRRVQ